MNRVPYIFLPIISLIITFNFHLELLAQEPILSSGDRIKVTSNTLDLKNDKMIFQSTDGHSLLVKADSMFVIPNSTINSLDVSKGRKVNLTKGIIYGVLTSATYLLIYHQAHPFSEGCSYNPDNADSCGTYWSFLGAGGLLGGLTGLFIETERWQKVDPKISQFQLGPLKHSDGFGLTYVLEF